MRKLFFLLAILASPALAQEQQVGRMAAKYDLDSTDFIYCRLEGQGGSPFAPGYTGPAPIKTSGSSATVVESTASTDPFTDVAVGDVLVADGNVMSVIARASAASITVDAAVTLAEGTTFRFFKHSCGTAATDGWISVSGAESVILGFEMNQEDTNTGVSVRWECRAPTPGAQAVQIYPDNSGGAAVKTYTAAGIDARTWVNITGGLESCRIGMKMASTDDGADTGAAMESINAYAVISRAIN
jgi:hypothetical protein